MILGTYISSGETLSLLPLYKKSTQNGLHFLKWDWKLLEKTVPLVEDQTSQHEPVWVILDSNQTND